MWQVFTSVYTSVCFVVQVGASAKRSTARAKVIVCRDNCVQTGKNLRCEMN